VASAGFERWNKIYGETDDVNKVQKDIRDGHAQTVDKVLAWFDAEGVKGKTVCDCGCGTGSLAIPTALRGAAVTASDISSSMVGEAERRYNAEIAKGVSCMPVSALSQPLLTIEAGQMVCFFPAG
jgi:magnesium-protoporphyrin O-methyltransferase